ncbi:MAG: FAD:protein FMN transferase [Chthonomonadales bacterium]
MRYLSMIVLNVLTACLPIARANINSDLKRFEFKQYHMGVDVRIVLYAATEDKAVSAASAAFERFAQLDDIMSDYRANSELMQLCAQAGGPPVKVSDTLYRVLERSQSVAQLSNGAFDVTCSPVVKLWRIARKAKSMPPTDDLKKALKLVSWKNLVLDPKAMTAMLLIPGMLLDLGGIGKGYGDDCAQEVLKKHGIKSALVEAGGDIVVSDPPPGKKGWLVRIDTGGKMLSETDLTFSNAAISTSGDTEQFVEIGGVRYSHIVDPHTGLGLTNRIAVTVVAANGLTSDSLTKVVSVLGPDRARETLKHFNVKKIYVKYPDGVAH